MAKRKLQHQWHQRQLFPNLKVGDKAYWINSGADFGKYIQVTVTGFCEEGDGFCAWSPEWEEKYPTKPHDPADPDNMSNADPGFDPVRDGNIHTCNGWMTDSLKAAKAESLRIAKALRPDYLETMKYNQSVVRYLDWIIYKKGKH